MRRETVLKAEDLPPDEQRRALDAAILATTSVRRGTRQEEVGGACELSRIAGVAQIFKVVQTKRSGPRPTPGPDTRVTLLRAAATFLAKSQRAGLPWR